MVIEVKKSFDCKMNYIGYVHICNAFLVSSNKIFSKVKETQDKKLRNLLLKNSETCQDLGKFYLSFQGIA